MFQITVLQCCVYIVQMYSTLVGTISAVALLRYRIKSFSVSNINIDTVLTFVLEVETCILVFPFSQKAKITVI